MRKGWVLLASFLVFFPLLASPCRGADTVVFGPERYDVGTGKPVPEVRHFPAVPGEAVLGLAIGGSKEGHGVSTGSVRLNGMEIFSPADFNQQITAITRKTQLQENNILQVSFGGKPGTYAVLTITSVTGLPISRPTATIDVSPGAILAGESAILSWATTGAQKVTIVPEIGETFLAGSRTVAPTQTTIYRITAEGPGGEATAEATLQVNQPPSNPGITFDLYEGIPLDGATIGRFDLTISGSLSAENPVEVGMVVNGIPAQVSGGRFLAGKIPLQPGTNSIKAVATDAGGKPYEATAQVFCSPAEQFVSLESDRTSGLAPLEIELRFDGALASPVAGYSLACDGPVSVTAVETSYDRATALLNEPGLYDCQLRVVDQQGQIFRDRVGVNVYSRTALDALLRSKWNSMKEGMAQGNPDLALVHFAERTRAIYASQMNAAISQLPRMAADMQEIHLLQVENSRAVYDLRLNKNGQIFSVPLEFIQDKDGLWRIRSF